MMSVTDDNLRADLVLPRPRTDILTERTCKKQKDEESKCIVVDCLPFGGSGFVPFLLGRR